jgi:UDP-glucose 4-epimerase
VQAIELKNVEAGAINIGMNQSTSLIQMIKILTQIIGTKPTITHASSRHGDIRHSRADNRKLLQQFNFTKQTPLKIGLEKLLASSE